MYSKYRDQIFYLGIVNISMQERFKKNRLKQVLYN